MLEAREGVVISGKLQEARRGEDRAKGALSYPEITACQAKSNPKLNVACPAGSSGHQSISEGAMIQWEALTELKFISSSFSSLSSC